ncbi:MAG TPA: GNAT family N-acetyltransferase [Thermoanaerobaculia bacterium]|jgi:GNAT superfamily N-acetyltransferase|nr:GNAT family N-acetyltransferase [Thermoanaerobaculia bacterium]
MDDIAAIETITRNCFRSFSGFRNAELIDDGRIFGVMSHVPISFFSGIATSDIDESEVEGVIDRFREKRCAFRWWITPSTRPHKLAPILASYGMRHAYDAPGMAADLTTAPLDAPSPAELTIRHLTKAEELTDWLEVFMPVFSRSAEEGAIWMDSFAQCGFGPSAGWQHFVGYVDGKAVATTSVLTVGALAGVYNVATLAEARGRGIGSAVTRVAMRYARDAGATQAALQSTELGYGVYQSLGFVQHCDLTLYDWHP